RALVRRRERGGTGKGVIALGTGAASRSGRRRGDRGGAPLPRHRRRAAESRAGAVRGVARGRDRARRGGPPAGTRFVVDRPQGYSGRRGGEAGVRTRGAAAGGGR